MRKTFAEDVNNPDRKSRCETGGLGVKQRQAKDIQNLREMATTNLDDRGLGLQQKPELRKMATTRPPISVRDGVCECSLNPAREVEGE